MVCRRASALTYARAATRAAARLARRLRGARASGRRPVVGLPRRALAGRWWSACSGHPRGRRRLRAARPDLPDERLRFLLRGLGGAAGAGRRAACVAGCPAGSAGAAPRRRERAGRRRRCSSPCGRPRAAGLCHLHLRLDRPAQGRSWCTAPRHRQPRGGHGRGLGSARATASCSSRRRAFDTRCWRSSPLLARGAALVLGAREDLMPGPDLPALLRERRVTYAMLTPSALAALPVPGPASCPACARSASAARRCPPELARRWSARPPARQRLRADRARRSAAAMAGASAGERHRVPIGRPIAEHARSTSWTGPGAGARSECRASCAWPARAWLAGYLGRPELTAERFVPDPFGGAGRRGSTAPATSRAGCRTARSSSWGASTTRSRCAASASSWARSRRRSPRIPRCARPRCSPWRLALAMPGWWPSWHGGGRRWRWPQTSPSELRAHLQRQLPDSHGARLLRRAARAAADAQRQGGSPGAVAAAPAVGSPGQTPDLDGSAYSRRGDARRHLGEVLRCRAGAAPATTSSHLGGHSLLATQVVSRVRDVFGDRAAAAQAVRGADRRRAGPTRSRRLAPPGCWCRHRPIVPVPRRGRAAPLLRPGAPLVPRPSQPGQRPLQPALRLPRARAARRPPPWPGACARSCAGTRRCAPPSPRWTAGRCRSIAPAPALALPPASTSASSRPRRARARAPAARGRRRRAPVPPRPRPAAARPAGALRRARARGGARPCTTSSSDGWSMGIFLP